MHWLLLQQQAGYSRRQYVPCYSDEAKVKYPRKSSLSAEQQALYLQLMVKYARKHSPFPILQEQKELEQYKVCILYVSHNLL
jgi:hypothetical protein